MSNNPSTKFESKPKVIFFDMDGVLFNSMFYHAKVWKEVFEAHDIHIDDKEPFLHEGATACQFAKYIFLKYQGINISKDQAENIKNEKHEKMANSENIEVINGMPDFVRHVYEEGVECWVVTGSGQKSLLNRLQSEFAPALSSTHMITANDVTKGKPSPEPYLKALAKSGYDRKEALVIENAPLGIQSAKDAGIFTIGINTGPLDSKMLLESGADLVFENAEELTEKWNEVLSNFANTY